MEEGRIEAMQRWFCTFFTKI